MSSSQFFTRMSGRQSADQWMKSWQRFLASHKNIEIVDWSRSRDAEFVFVMTSNFELPGTINRVLDLGSENGTHFWNPQGQLYKIHPEPKNRPRHDPTLKLGRGS